MSVTAAAALERSSPPAVLSFPVDVLTVGSLSAVAVLLYAATGRVSATTDVFDRFAVLTAAINFPHFIASGALLYGSREVMARHRVVSFVLPAVLLLWMVVGQAMWPQIPHLSNVLTIGAAVLLAWHYTGQTFGMMASYGYVEGVSFKPDERRLLRINLYVLLAWHVLWALSAVIYAGSTDAGAKALATHDLHVTAPLALSSSLFGALALVKMRRRLGHWPGPRVIVPWLAVHGWYALMAVDARALFLAQISHALQYLPFPLRVHLNRTRTSPWPPMLRAATYLGGLVLAGQAAFVWIPEVLQQGLGAMGWTVSPFATALGTVLNIHHYFVDGVVWKISNPKVRKDLFSHLEER